MLLLVSQCWISEKVNIMKYESISCLPLPHIIFILYVIQDAKPVSSNISADQSRDISMLLTLTYCCCCEHKWRLAAQPQCAFVSVKWGRHEKVSVSCLFDGLEGLVSACWPANTMVWIKIAAVSAIGVYGYRSVSRVNQLVNQVKVPRHSLLDKYNSKVWI